MTFNKPEFWDKKINILSLILYPFSLVFFIIVLLRKKLILKKSFNIPIICIGNIYLGGTGKTPASIYIAKELSRLRKKPAILRKFYAAHEDEYRLIKKNFKNLILNNNRQRGIREAERKKFNTIILDDGFQDYSIKKNFNIICFNHNQLEGNGLILPAGPLRESLNSLKEVDLILINGKKNVKFEKKILRINKKLDIFYSNYKPVNSKQFRGKKLIAIAGIGNPNNFFKLLSDLNIRVEKKFIFPDHYQFKKSEILSILKEAKRNNCELIMTEKDYFKLKKFNLKSLNYLKLSFEIKNKRKLLNKILKIYD